MALYSFWLLPLMGFIDRDHNFLSLCFRRQNKPYTAAQVPVNSSWTWAASIVYLILLRSDDNTIEFVFPVKIFFQMHSWIMFILLMTEAIDSSLLYPRVSYWTPFLSILRYFWITNVMFQTETLAFYMT